MHILLALVVIAIALPFLIFAAPVLLYVGPLIVIGLMISYVVHGSTHEGRARHWGHSRHRH